jgi:hypothetical protein
MKKSHLLVLGSLSLLISACGKTPVENTTKEEAVTIADSPQKQPQHNTSVITKEVKPVVDKNRENRKEQKNLKKAAWWDKKKFSGLDLDETQKQKLDEDLKSLLKEQSRLAIQSSELQEQLDADLENGELDSFKSNLEQLQQLRLQQQQLQTENTLKALDSLNSEQLTRLSENPRLRKRFLRQLQSGDKHLFKQKN